MSYYHNNIDNGVLEKVRAVKVSVESGLEIDQPLCNYLSYLNNHLYKANARCWHDLTEEVAEELRKIAAISLKALETIDGD